MSEIVIVYRNGEEKLRVPAKIQNGILRSGENILINADLIPTGKKDWVKEQMRKKNITPEIEAMGMKIGDNGNGLIVEWQDDVIARERAAAKAVYDALPAETRAANKERNTITDLYDRAYKALNYDTDDDNVSRGYRLRAQADKLFSEWRVKYPKEAMKEKATELIMQAEKEEDIAAGALIYDLDGWISSAEQQHRHDEFINKANELRREAEELFKKANEPEHQI